MKSFKEYLQVIQEMKGNDSIWEELYDEIEKLFKEPKRSNGAMLLTEPLTSKQMETLKDIITSNKNSQDKAEKFMKTLKALEESNNINFKTLYNDFFTDSKYILMKNEFWENQDCNDFLEAFRNKFN